MNYNWDWSILFREPYLGWLISGLGRTVSVALCAWVIAFSLVSVIGVLRTLPSKPVRLFATAYVELFRNIPLLVMVAPAKEDGMTMMVVTHEMGFARKVAHRVIFIDKGAIVEDAPTADFFGKPRSERAQDFLAKILHH